MRFGVDLQSLGVPLRRSLTEASRMGAAGVQADAVGDLHPDRLSDTGRRELRNLLRSYNLELAALHCPMRRGLDVAEDQQRRIEGIQKAMTLSFDLGARLVTLQAGPVPDKADSAASGLLTEALLAIGHHGDRTGSAAALETGLNSGKQLADFLAGFDSGGLGVCYDPANLVINGYDAVAELLPLREYIRHVQAKDARRARANRAAQEVEIGAGDIDWLAFLGTLAATDYKGFILVRRDSGERRADDVAAGLKLLRKLA